MGQPGPPGDQNIRQQTLPQTEVWNRPDCLSRGSPASRQPRIGETSGPQPAPPALRERTCLSTKHEVCPREGGTERALQTTPGRPPTRGKPVLLRAQASELGQLPPPPPPNPVGTQALTDGIVYVLHGALQLLLQRLLLHARRLGLRWPPSPPAPPLRSSQEVFEVLKGAVFALHTGPAVSQGRGGPRGAAVRPSVWGTGVRRGHRGTGVGSLWGPRGRAGLRGGEHAVEAVRGPESPASRGQQPVGIRGQRAAAGGGGGAYSGPADEGVQRLVHRTLELLQELRDGVVGDAASTGRG